MTISHSLLLLEPGVPEVEERDRAEVAPQLLARHSQPELIAELDPSYVLIEEDLDAVDDGFPLPRVHLAGQLAEESLLFLEAPPAGIGAMEDAGQRRVHA